MEIVRDHLFALRWHLGGLSAVWLAVLVLNLGSGPADSIVLARENLPPAKVILAALVENRRELLELTDTPEAIAPAALPPRRTELQTATEVV